MIKNTTTPRYVSISKGPKGRELTQADAESWKPEPGTLTTLRFGDGLVLAILASGRRVWRCQLQRANRTTNVTLGELPAMNLKRARLARARIKVSGIPAVVPAAGEDRSFAAVAQDWLRTRRSRWTPRALRHCEQRLALHVLPVWGKRQVAEITIRDCRYLIEELHAGVILRGRELGGPAAAAAVKRALCGVFDLALAERWIAYNPMRQTLPFLPRQPRAKRQPAAVTLEQARKVLRAVERQAGRLGPTVILAHRFVALTGVRSEEALRARWSEIDLDAGVWTIPGARMKHRDDDRPHIVCLAPQAIEVLRAARFFRRQDADLVFTSHWLRKAGLGHGALSAAMSAALKGTGLRAVPHGWRGTFLTIVSERSRADRAVADIMLAHLPEGMSSDEWRYSRAQWLEDQRRIACAWADLLLEGSPSPHALLGLPREETQTNVVPLRRAS
jgi:integrase